MFTYSIFDYDKRKVNNSLLPFCVTVLAKGQCSYVLWRIMFNLNF